MGGVNRLRCGEVCKWLIWMAKINAGRGQEDAVGVGLSPDIRRGMWAFNDLSDQCESCFDGNNEVDAWNSEVPKIFVIRNEQFHSVFRG